MGITHIMTASNTPMWPGHLNRMLERYQSATLKQFCIV
jgi:hypothetical protein